MAPHPGPRAKTRYISAVPVSSHCSIPALALDQRCIRLCSLERGSNSDLHANNACYSLPILVEWLLPPEEECRPRSSAGVCCGPPGISLAYALVLICPFFCLPLLSLGCTSHVFAHCERASRKQPASSIHAHKRIPNTTIARLRRLASSSKTHK
ncbi:hypothetical protein GQ54DRAFT_39116 [Martensiomyces pterosporus]|nr:hypothetical protein GQ54DRAFT_39116 [Martensiomyces pterosporus]